MGSVPEHAPPSYRRQVLRLVDDTCLNIEGRHRFHPLPALRCGARRRGVAEAVETG
jgi:hypothetical protein